MKLKFEIYFSAFSWTDHLSTITSAKPDLCMWEKVLVKVKLVVFCSCRTTVLAAVAFLDAFQKVADMATNTRGRTAVSVCGCVWEIPLYLYYCMYKSCALVHSVLWFTALHALHVAVKNLIIRYYLPACWTLLWLMKVFPAALRFTVSQTSKHRDNKSILEMLIRVFSMAEHGVFH